MVGGTREKTRFAQAVCLPNPRWSKRGERYNWECFPRPCANSRYFGN